MKRAFDIDMYCCIAHNEKGHFTSQEKGTFLKLEGGGGGG